MKDQALQAPFPWFGGKSRAADVIWRALGDVDNYVEPFAGSLAVMLGRPVNHRRKIETVNDLDAFLSNFWRSVSYDPEATAHYANWPVNAVDLNARHAYLVGVREQFARKMEGDPEFYDPKIAGWWVSGVCGWIGSGYCSGEGPWVVMDGLLVDRRKMPHLGDAGQGINRQMPHLGDAGQGINRQSQPVLAWFETLAQRLQNVRVTCGDWSSVLSESVTTHHGATGVVLDPPYSSEVEQSRVYATDSTSVARDVRRWAVENGNNRHLRIALCGYAGEGHGELTDYGWTVHAWKTAGGYGGGRGGSGEDNRSRERIYFSPACETDDDLLGLL